MASTNKTANYDLSQFIETDKPGWLTDYNSDMRKIDSNLKSVSETASGASADLSALTDRVSTAEGAITQNTNDITSLDARTDSLEAQVQASAGAITNLQTEQITQNLGIEAATKLGYNIARPYDAASTYAVGDYALFQNTLYKCITAVEVGEAFVPAKWLAIKVMDEVGGLDEEFEIIPINADNFPLSPNISGSVEPFDSSSSAITITNPVISFVENNFHSNYYAKYKNIRILELNIRVAPEQSFSIVIPGSLSLSLLDIALPSFIDLPKFPVTSCDINDARTDNRKTVARIRANGSFNVYYAFQGFKTYGSPTALSSVDMSMKFIYLVD